MPRIRRGSLVRDPRGRRARVAKIERVPASVNLFGDPVPGSLRAVLVYDDFRWANDVPVRALEAVG